VGREAKTFCGANQTFNVASKILNPELCHTTDVLDDILDSTETVQDFTQK